jgi:hypothetical protein
MPKFSGVDEFKAGTFSYDVGGGKVATLDVAAAFPSIAVMEPHELGAFHFAIKTAARNARASIKPEQIDAAFEAVTDRFNAWAKKVWRAASESTGESRTSLLARAVAEAMGIEVAEAAEQISGLIEASVDAAGLSADEEADKAKIRKIGADIRDQLKKSVAKIYARLQAEEAVKRAELVQNATPDAAVKTTAELLKR